MPKTEQTLETASKPAFPVLQRTRRTTQASCAPKASATTNKYTQPVLQQRHAASFTSAFANIDAGLQLCNHAVLEIEKISVMGPWSGIQLIGVRRRSIRATKIQGAALSPHFTKYAHLDKRPHKNPDERTAKIERKRTPKQSAYFQLDPFSKFPVPQGLAFDLEVPQFGLIQERIRNSLYALVVQAILWNQTTGRAARPILFTLLSQYSTPEALAAADPANVLAIIQTLGLQKIRSGRLIKMARSWIEAPPHPSRCYNRRNYPRPGDNLGLKDGQLLDEASERTGWEIAHLAGVGPYALDSYRIFHRDQLRGRGRDDREEPEWKRVVPMDKDLRAYLVWRWREEGYIYEPMTGRRTIVSAD